MATITESPHDLTAARRAAWERIEELGRLAARDRDAGAAQLADLFATGTPSRGVDGPTNGILVAPLIHPVADAAARRLTSLWMPWLGKSFHQREGRGENRLAASARWPSKLLWPLYSTRPGERSRLAFDFETRVEPGAVAPRVDVLVIDYAPVEENPRLVIRRIRDELVELVDGVHLGRILWRGADGGYTNIGYFALRSD